MMRTVLTASIALTTTTLAQAPEQAVKQANDALLADCATPMDASK
jgi:hypothetical protein